MKKIYLPTYSDREEIINSVSHGVGFIISVAGYLILLSISKSISTLVCYSIYGVILMLLYIISCLYHGISKKYKAKLILRVIDHCNVYLLVAATYTPITLICLHDTLGYSICFLVWVVTIIGIILTCINIDKYQNFSLIHHLITGWAVLFLLKDLFIKMNTTCIFLLLLGGVFYSIGALLYKLGSRKKYMHSIFHFFVLAGSIAHFFTIYKMI